MMKRGGKKGGEAVAPDGVCCALGDRPRWVWAAVQ